MREREEKRITTCRPLDFTLALVSPFLVLQRFFFFLVFIPCKCKSERGWVFSHTTKHEVEVFFIFFDVEFFFFHFWLHLLLIPIFLRERRGHTQNEAARAVAAPRGGVTVVVFVALCSRSSGSSSNAVPSCGEVDASGSSCWFQREKATRTLEKALAKKKEGLLTFPRPLPSLP